MNPIPTAPAREPYFLDMPTADRTERDIGVIVRRAICVELSAALLAILVLSLTVWAR